ncbi:MAG: pyridoxamine 5'-phosphate oxidase family protein [bacterium]|nr:pyridoxamine 5'-phosphate oxidase family protein [bacterium]
MFTEKFLEVLNKEGVVAIVSCADNEAHVVNTWNTYLVKTDDGRLLIPAWAMRKTEKKILKNDRVLLTLGSKEVEGRRGPGCGFLIEGTARYIASGPEWDRMKDRFSFLTRVLEVTVTSIKQTL